MKLSILFAGKRILFWITIPIIALIDQLTKFFFFDWLDINTPYTVIPNFFNIVHRTNPAAAFSLGPESPLFYVIATIVGMGLLIWLLLDLPSENKLPSLALGAIAGGAMGNLTDRIIMGEVRDFIDVHWFYQYHWPAFNVADAAICIGVAVVFLVGVKSFRDPEEGHKKNSS